MHSKPVLVAFVVFFVILITSSARATSREFINSAASGDKIEFYWAKPEGKGPFPALLLIHPDQEAPKAGGQVFVENGQIDHWSKKGFVTIAVSQPGYGGSQGSSDFCGPRTQRAAAEVIRHFLSKAEVDAARFFVYGGSRGAVVAGMLAAANAGLRGVVLKSGVYDFPSWAAGRPFYDSIKLSMFWEIGWLSSEKLLERSAISVADKIKVPLLVIHGTKDERAPIAIAENFVRKINSSGGTARLVQIESEHVIPMPKIVDLMEDFFKGLP